MKTTRNYAPHPGPLPASGERERNARSRRRSRWPAAVLGATFLFVAAGLCADSPGEAAPAGKVNINAASAAQIAFLPRIGEKVAVRVIEYRKSNGPFARTEDLMEVKGIGEKLFLTLKPYLAVSGPTTLAAKVRAGSPRKKGASVPANKPAQKPAPASVPAGKGR
jgi:competence protein ComEA